MRLSVIGTGYLGATHATAMASFGHDVVGLDVDELQVKKLQEGELPFFEPGLAEPLADLVAGGSLRFTTDPADLADREVHFVCVGTPQRQDGAAADLTYVDAAFATLVARLRQGSVVVGRSTVPVGTAQRLAPLVERAGGHLVWNPEFLREGYALHDCAHPDRIVVGTSGTDAGGRAADLLLQAYEPMLSAGTHVVRTDYATAELVKVAANAFLATKISFVNAMAELCDASGADVRQLALAIGLDPRVGPAFLRAGIGYGGSCLPKDVRALAARAEELGVEDVPGLLHAVDAVNGRRLPRTLALVREACGGGSVAGHRIGVLGLAFKPNSDDIRDSPALAVAGALASEGAIVQAFDPRAMARAAAADGRLQMSADPIQACVGAEVVVVLTDWPQLRGLDPARVSAAASGRTVIDGRNCLDPNAWRAAGWTYRGVGVPTAVH